MSYELVNRRLEQALGDCPLALAAAISEVRYCKMYEEHLKGVLREMPEIKDPNEAVFCWALYRGRLWSRYIECNPQ